MHTVGTAGMLSEFIDEGKTAGVRGYGTYGHAIRTDMHWTLRTLEFGGS